ncbi:MAG: carboxypeptidase-like regulatory domain-containing protein [Terriglobales bacterium]
MRGVRIFRSPAGLFASLLLFIGSLCAQQDPPQNSAAQKPVGSTSLRICLRLQDESPFSGSAAVRVMPSEGYEVSGTMESEGEMVFADVPPGTYTMETSAPGFLTVRQKIQIEANHGLLTRFVVMKPKVFHVLVPEKSAALPSSAPAPEKTSWVPPDIDEAVPYVDPNVECPLPHVLNGAAQRMKQFVGNLEKFTASERVEHSVVDALGTRQSPAVRKFDYVVMVSRERAGGFLLEEYRNGSIDPEQFPAHIATQGLPGLALLFHPFLASDYKFTCEGLGEWAGNAAWQVHFVQRADRPGRLLAYSAGGRSSSVALKGRAWIDPGTFQVLRLESDLVEPLKDFDLTEQHIAISYQRVQFRTLGQQLWLPQVADLYVQRQGHRYYRRHTFSNFQLFTVDATENIQLAKESYGFTNESDHDIAGVLTVTPVSGVKLDPVSVLFTIPAGGSVTKLVGPGKDVSIPVESVGFATFAHNGPLDSVKVDAHLSKESTLDVISGTSIPAKP